ncbi:MAG: Holo-acyl carrier protein synthase [Hydrocarboniphaga sp.]|uniref:holo-ACP synthase n=1 Tax=Hydrocarboniphaga sp. TaxID=2033016 RepID=UPI002631CD40|nr:holo-ACP synthase [Hydrocarboniphaga sp.]MDB5967910.1 Holo-acyl carrier protein synthase [Hydrocarboniphaga sp.]
MSGGSFRRGGTYAGGVPRAAATAAPARSAIYGVGIDLLHISRMAEVHGRHAERLAQRILHPLELQRLGTVKNPVNYLAKCFAVKEAFVKALGTGFRGIAHDEVGWTRIQHGRPELCVTPRVQAMLASRGIGAMHLSITDELDLVCAVVTLERST